MSTQHGEADRLVQMANDIGAFFRVQPREDAINGIANHIRSFWTPRMRSKLVAALEQQECGLDELPLAAMHRLLTPQTAAPPAPGGDAG